MGLNELRKKGYGLRKVDMDWGRKDMYWGRGIWIGEERIGIWKGRIRIED